MKIEKCTQHDCEEIATMISKRGDEEIPYCENHGNWFNKLMEDCFYI